MALRQRQCYAFGGFTLDPGSRTLARDGEPVALFPKCFDVLLYMVQNPGRVVTKDELLRNVWPDAFVEEGNLSQNVSLLRKALDDRGSSPRFIATIPGKGYQFIAAATEVLEANEWQETTGANGELILHAVRERVTSVVEETSTDGAPVEVETTALLEPAPRFSRRWKTASAVLLGLAVAVGGWLTYENVLRQRALGGQRKLVIADFTGSAGDGSLNSVLRGALAVDLKQSPYFTFLSQADVQNTLGEMGKEPKQPLTPDVAREVCERNNAQAVVHGAIAQLGQRYLITLDSVDCGSGRELTSGKKDVADLDSIPHALDELAAAMRRELGESNKSIQQYSSPLFAARTGSLEALKAFSTAEHLGLEGKFTASIPFFERAIELDPNFATAYLDLSAIYSNLRDTNKSNEYLKKAYELRDTTDEPDRLFTVARYHEAVTGDIWESIRNYQTWAETYPSNPLPWAQLADIYIRIGQPEKAVEPAKKALALQEKGAEGPVQLGRAQLHAGQLKEALEVCRDALPRFPNSGSLHGTCLQVDYILQDKAGVDAEIAWSKSNAEGQDVQVVAARIAMAEGRVKEGETLFATAGETAKRRGMGGLANFFRLANTRILADVGLLDAARKDLKEVSMISGMVDPVVALAETGNTTQAAAILEQDRKEHSVDLLWHCCKGAQIQAAILMAEHKPQEAVQALEPAQPFNYQGFDLFYMRGRAYLQAGQPRLAATEFQQIIDHPGLDPVSYEYRLAFLGLARARAMDGQTGPSREAYQKFFEVWKNADEELPVLKSAREEYARLGAR